jgi:pyruvate formate lyase activating enzyme
MESRYQERVDEGTSRCIICPRMCILKEGQRGFCGTKENQKGAIMNLTYGLLSAMAVDPIEKKPLAHFYPGSLSLSVSSVG